MLVNEHSIKTTLVTCCLNDEYATQFSAKITSFCSAWCLTMTPTTDQGEEKKIYILHSTFQELLRMGGPVENLRDKGHE